MSIIQGTIILEIFKNLDFKDARNFSKIYNHKFYNILIKVIKLLPYTLHFPHTIFVHNNIIYCIKKINKKIPNIFLRNSELGLFLAEKYLFNIYRALYSCIVNGDEKTADYLVEKYKPKKQFCPFITLKSADEKKLFKKYKKYIDICKITMLVFFPDKKKIDRFNEIKKYHKIDIQLYNYTIDSEEDIKKIELINSSNYSNFMKVIKLLELFNIDITYKKFMRICIKYDKFRILKKFKINHTMIPSNGISIKMLKFLINLNDREILIFLIKNYCWKKKHIELLEDLTIKALIFDPNIILPFRLVSNFQINQIIKFSNNINFGVFLCKHSKKFDLEILKYIENNEVNIGALYSIKSMKVFRILQKKNISTKNLIVNNAKICKILYPEKIKPKWLTYSNLEVKQYFNFFCVRVVYV